MRSALRGNEFRGIGRAAAKIVHGDRLVLPLVEPVSQSRRRRLVDDALHFEPGNPPRILGRLPLRVVEISRHRDDRFGHFLAQVVFRRLFQLLQDHRRDLRRSEFLPLRHHRHVVPVPLHLIRDHRQLFADLVIAPSHKPLDRENRVLRIGNGLPLGDLPHQPFPGLGKSHARRRSPPTFFIRDHFRLPALHDSYARVRSSQVNSDDFSHIRILRYNKCFTINAMMITS